MLASLPFKFVRERDLWLMISMACRHLDDNVCWSVEVLWDQWSQTSDDKFGIQRPKYDPVQNEKDWNSLKPNREVSFFSLLHHAKEGGFDIKPWKKMAEATARAARWRHLEAPEPDFEVIEVEADVVDLTRAPGLLGLIIDHAEKTSNRETRFFGLAGGLVAISAASRHKFLVKSPRHVTPLNVLVNCMAPTGAGKDEARAEVLRAREESPFHAVREAASDAGLHALLLRHSTVAMMVDEFGRFLQALDKRGSHDYKMLTLLMQAFTSATSELPERQYANARDNKPAVLAPFLTGLFTSTNSELLDGLDAGAATSGFLGRMLILKMDDLPPLAGLPEEVDDTAIRDALRSLGEYQMPESNGLSDPRFHLVRGRRFRLIQMTDEAREYYSLQRRLMDAEVAKQTAAAPLWSRALENALRVAGIVSVGKAALADMLEEVKVDLEDIQYALRLVVCCIEKFAPDAEEHLVDGKYEGIRKRILRAVSKHAGPDGWALRTEVIKAAKGGDVPYKQVSEELDALCDPDAYAELVERMDENGQIHKPLQVRLARGILSPGLTSLERFPLKRGL
ncbi:MAG: PriCT-2 domain-containing protein [Pseudomonadota bacterium]